MCSYQKYMQAPVSFWYLTLSIWNIRTITAAYGGMVIDKADLHSTEEYFIIYDY